MIRFFLRFTGFWLLAAGFVALIVDGTRSIAASSLLLMSAGDAWFAVSPGSLAALEAWARARSPALWDSGITSVLSVPAFLLLLVLGIVLMTLGRVRERSRFEAG
jgi:hypothetical protein